MSKGQYIYIYIYIYRYDKRIQYYKVQRVEKYLQILFPFYD